MGVSSANKVRHELFTPDPALALAASCAVADEFWKSLCSIAAAIGREGPFEDIATVRRSMSIPASCFAAYFDLLQAVLDDDLPLAQARFDAVIARLHEPTPSTIRSLSDLDPLVRTLLSSYIADETTRVVLRPASPESFEAASRSITSAMALFDEAAPEIADEIRATINEIILVSGTFNETGTFDGATLFGFWGALLLNADEHATRVEAVDGLAHESAHAVLFGRSLGKAFVENPDTERHASPLRADPRPLDGIFHAMFVSARMHYAHQKLLQAGVLTEEEAAVSKTRLAASRGAFLDGYQTVTRHAHLTDLGRSLFDAAADYMRPAIDESRLNAG